MRVLVTGGRAFTNRTWVFRVLDVIHRHVPIQEILQGGARGVDAIADDWTETTERTRSVTFNADWDAHGVSAGPKRNQAMIDTKPDILVAFPGGRGTADCTRRARAAGIPVYEAREGEPFFKAFPGLDAWLLAHVKRTP